MPAPNVIAAEKLLRLIGLPTAPLILDVRTPSEGLSDWQLIPGSIPLPLADADLPATRRVVVACADGGAHSQSVAALLRQRGIAAEVLEAGLTGWADAGLPRIPAGALPPRDAMGRTLWVTRARPKVDRIACPWLIRRFVDPLAAFLFVPPSDVLGVASRLGAEPFDIEGDGVRWSHAGDDCSFDALLHGLGLAGFDALARLAIIVRGADTGQPGLAPEAAGLLAISLGLSRLFDDDHGQLEAGMLVYDALYRWSRDATTETHDWVSHQPAATRAKPRP